MHSIQRGAEESMRRMNNKIWTLKQAFFLFDLHFLHPMGNLTSPLFKVVQVIIWYDEFGVDFKNTVTFHLLSVYKCWVTNLKAYLLQTLIENKQSLTKATSAIQLLFITKFHSISFQLSGSIFFRVAIISTFKVTDSISIPDDYRISFQDDSNISFWYDASISFHDDSQFLV